MRRKPCPTCPWWRHQHADEIPGFGLELAEGLAPTCDPAADISTPQFACHQSKEGGEFACAGWMTVNGVNHPAVRVGLMTGAIDPDQLTPDPSWPELHDSYEDMMVKLREDFA